MVFGQLGISTNWTPGWQERTRPAMAEYFLLRGPRALLREAVAAWTSLTVGSILFGIIAVRFTPTIGVEAAFAAALIVSAPVASMLLQGIRTGRVGLPDLKIPEPAR